MTIMAIFQAGLQKNGKALTASQRRVVPVPRYKKIRVDGRPIDVNFLVTLA